MHLGKEEVKLKSYLSIKVNLVKSDNTNSYMLVIYFDFIRCVCPLTRHQDGFLFEHSNLEIRVLV